MNFRLFIFNFTNRWRFVFLYGDYKNGNLKLFNFAQSFLQFLQTLEIRLIFSFLSVFLRSMPLLFFWIQPKINFLPLTYLRLRTRGRTIEWGFFWRVLSHSCFHLFFFSFAVCHRGENIGSVSTQGTQNYRKNLVSLQSWVQVR